MNKEYIIKNQLSQAEYEQAYQLLAPHDEEWKKICFAKAIAEHKKFLSGIMNTGQWPATRQAAKDFQEIAKHWRKWEPAMLNQIKKLAKKHYIKMFQTQHRDKEFVPEMKIQDTDFSTTK